mmetsp:Transcript_70277/g.81920  ORF Transcript_70277/g.81920 Transcript_70277/m.81920 type:complete len:190 (-) Transcript_70277:156-725(-)
MERDIRTRDPYAGIEQTTSVIRRNPESQRADDLDFDVEAEATALFKAFKQRNGKVSTGELLSYISESNDAIRSGCRILAKRIDLIRAHRGIELGKDLELEEKDFKNLFSAHLRDREIFGLVFELLDETRKGELNYEDLKNANRICDLRFKENDLFMIVDCLKPKDQGGVGGLPRDTLYKTLFPASDMYS